MRKKFALVLMGTMLALCLAFASCGDSGKKELRLPKTEYACEIEEVFTLPEAEYLIGGVPSAAQIDVAVTFGGEPVAVDGKTFTPVKKGAYLLAYTLAGNSEIAALTATLTVTDPADGATLHTLKTAYEGELGAEFELPAVELKTSDGRILTRQILAEASFKGESVTISGGKIQLSDTGVYTVKFSVPGYPDISPLSVTVTVSDTGAPTVVIDGFKNVAVTGEDYILPEVVIKDFSEVDRTKTLISLKDGEGNDVALTDNKFMPASGKVYTLSIYVCDTLGNDKTFTYTITALDPVSFTIEGLENGELTSVLSAGNKYDLTGWVNCDQDDAFFEYFVNDIYVADPAAYSFGVGDYTVRITGDNSAAREKTVQFTLKSRFTDETLTGNKLASYDSEVYQFAHSNYLTDPACVGVTLFAAGNETIPTGISSGALQVYGQQYQTVNLFLAKRALSSETGGITLKMHINGNAASGLQIKIGGKEWNLKHNNVLKLGEWATYFIPTTLLSSKGIETVDSIALQCLDNEVVFYIDEISWVDVFDGDTLVNFDSDSDINRVYQWGLKAAIASIEGAEGKALRLIGGSGEPAVIYFNRKVTLSQIESLDLTVFIPTGGNVVLLFPDSGDESAIVLSNVVTVQAGKWATYSIPADVISALGASGTTDINSLRFQKADGNSPVQDYYIDKISVTPKASPDRKIEFNDVADGVYNKPLRSDKPTDVLSIIKDIEANTVYSVYVNNVIVEKPEAFLFEYGNSVVKIIGDRGDDKPISGTFRVSVSFGDRTLGEGVLADFDENGYKSLSGTFLTDPACVSVTMFPTGSNDLPLGITSGALQVYGQTYQTVNLSLNQTIRVDEIGGIALKLHINANATSGLQVKIGGKEWNLKYNNTIKHGEWAVYYIPSTLLLHHGIETLDQIALQCLNDEVVFFIDEISLATSFEGNTLLNFDSDSDKTFVYAWGLTAEIASAEGASGKALNLIGGPGEPSILYLGRRLILSEITSLEITVKVPADGTLLMFFPDLGANYVDSFLNLSSYGTLKPGEFATYSIPVKALTDLGLNKINSIRVQKSGSSEIYSIDSIACR